MKFQKLCSKNIGWSHTEGLSSPLKYLTPCAVHYSPLNLPVRWAFSHVLIMGMVWWHFHKVKIKDASAYHEQYPKSVNLFLKAITWLPPKKKNYKGFVFDIYLTHAKHKQIIILTGIFYAMKHSSGFDTPFDQSQKIVPIRNIIQVREK